MVGSMMIVAWVIVAAILITLALRRDEKVEGDWTKLISGKQSEHFRLAQAQRGLVRYLRSEAERERIEGNHGEAKRLVGLAAEYEAMIDPSCKQVESNARMLSARTN